MTELLYNTLNAESFAGMSKESLIDALHELREAYNGMEVAKTCNYELWQDTERDFVSAQFKCDKLKDEVKDLETANQSWKDEQAKNIDRILGLEEHVNYLHKIYNNKLNK